MRIMNHGAYQRALQKKTIAELEFIIRDAQETLLVWEAGSGEHHPESDYYIDEINYASMELARRKRR